MIDVSLIHFGSSSALVACEADYLLSPMLQLRRLMKEKGSAVAVVELEVAGYLADFLGFASKSLHRI